MNKQWLFVAALATLAGSVYNGVRAQSVAGGGFDGGARAGGVLRPAANPTVRPTARGNQENYLSGAQGGAKSQIAGGGIGTKRYRKKPARNTSMRGANKSNRRRKPRIARYNVMGGTRAGRLNKPSGGGFMARTAVLKGSKSKKR